MIARALVGLVLLFASCNSDKRDDGVVGSNAPITLSPDDEVAESALQSLAAISELATRHGKNCDALANDLAAHAKRATPMIVEFKKLAADPTKQQAIAARFGERIQQVGQKAVASLRTHCAAHPAIKGVFKQLE
jgi:hypothetical protein